MSTESTDIKLISEKITQQAWVTIDHFFTPSLLHALFEEVYVHEASKALSLVFVGHKEGKKICNKLGVKK